MPLSLPAKLSAIEFSNEFNKGKLYGKYLSIGARVKELWESGTRERGKSIKVHDTHTQREHEWKIVFIRIE